MPKWRNWQTRTTQTRVPSGVWVRPPPSALFYLCHLLKPPELYSPAVGRANGRVAWATFFCAVRTPLRYFVFLLLGLAVGIGLGLYLGWVTWPTQYTEDNPSILQQSYQQDFLLMTAVSYSDDGNLGAATQRVDSLGENGRSLLLNTTIDLILTNPTSSNIPPLARLANDLGENNPTLLPYLTEGSP